MNDVLIISNYFPPEIGAASNRIFQLAKGLSSTYKVKVICPRPNYPTGKIFKDYKKYEVINGVEVQRLWVYPSVSKNKFIRLFSMLSFSLSIVWFYITHSIPKTIIVNSPPLIVAYTSLLFLRKKKYNLILNVSDLWPMAGVELGAIKKGLGNTILERIERYNYRKATKILGQSDEILAHIKTIVPNSKTLLYRNFPDFEPPKLNLPLLYDSSKKIKIVYAGLLGVAQGILKLCENLEYSNIEFHIYGSGAEEKKVMSFLKNNSDLPITFHGSVSRKALHHQLLTYDVTIIPLLNRIYGSVPSKIFEYSRLGLPVIYFGGGEGETIVLKHNLGWVAEAANYNSLNEVIAGLKPSDFDLNLKKEVQKRAIDNFNAHKQLEALKAFI
ncbi:MAG: glycosyltransferase WbuB [Winogradskyella sp.]|uniref:glycosyltransferase family 4 protein n=1 Tax=Winogradskyella sp. TaxID=1883156 RepID=UPI000F4045F8|nr:glycosyltransferase family 4 protein [Winogradskyella sp.]RNC88189.1 MAG: glycosyltransferase WbuB [Winogradskyella sp.]